MKPHYLTIAGRPVKSWMVTAALAAAAVAYVALIFVPGQRAIAKLRAEVGEKQQHVLQADGLTLPIRQAELRLASTREYSTQWHASAPGASDLVGCYSRLADEAKSAGVYVKRLDPQPAVEMQMICQHPLTITFEGTFPQVFDLVRRIEALPQTIWVRDLRVSAGDGGSETLQAEMSLTIFADRPEIAD
jgi:Tfp pilus assembly protein PilO